MQNALLRLRLILMQEAFFMDIYSIRGCFLLGRKVIFINSRFCAEIEEEICLGV